MTADFLLKTYRQLIASEIAAHRQAGTGSDPEVLRYIERQMVTALEVATLFGIEGATVEDLHGALAAVRALLSEIGGDDSVDPAALELIPVASPQKIGALRRKHKREAGEF